MQATGALICRKFALITVFTLLLTGIAYSQSVPLPYQYQFYQKFNADVYSVNNNSHTALKPFLIDSFLINRYDSLMTLGHDYSNQGWILRKIFNEHLFDVVKEDYTFYADFVVDLSVGQDVSGKRNTWLNSRGFQLGGTIGKKFSFYTSGFENQGRFADYYTDYVDSTGMVPGEAFDRKPGRRETTDWSYVTAVINYSPIKQLNFAMGQDKHFIGDGYRSLLLSDYATNYPFFRVTADIGPLQYTAMWAQMQDFSALKIESHADIYTNNRRKWAAFHYLDWNISNRVSLGFFNAYIVPQMDDNGVKRGFDVNFINPVFFASSLGSSSQPGNSLAGFTGKYKFLNKHAVYGQFLIDKVQGMEGKSITATGYQAGVRGADLFGVRSLNYLAEYNTVQPYAYTGAELLSSYSAFSEPLAHPYTANFKEVVGIINYSVSKFDFQGKVIYSRYGLDGSSSDNFGKNFNKPFNGDNIAGTTVAQGVGTSLKFAQGTLGYIINPVTNLRVEAGAILRQEKNANSTSNTAWFTLGIRSTFRNLYQDF